MRVTRNTLGSKESKSGSGSVLALFFALLVIGWAKPALAESPEEVYGDRYANNSVYLEGLGPGLVYSLNYDRVLGEDFSLRAGLGLVLGEEKSASGEKSIKPLILSIPVMLNYIGSGSRWSMLEVGAGLVLLHVGARVSYIYVQKRDNAETSPVAAALLGYRYQPPNGGFMFRAGVTAFVGRYGFLPLWPYASAGWSF
ncbi:MAG TPA: hypothetical protein VH142_08240 [Polyangiaceae bacterium]|jgi:hypothetical protein|nr:hypothetical protein [Polyangiaceae bacterium]